MFEPLIPVPFRPVASINSFRGDFANARIQLGVSHNGLPASSINTVTCTFPTYFLHLLLRIVNCVFPKWIFRDNVFYPGLSVAWETTFFTPLSYWTFGTRYGCIDNDVTLWKATLNNPVQRLLYEASSINDVQTFWITRMSRGLYSLNILVLI